VCLQKQKRKNLPMSSISLRLRRGKLGPCDPLYVTDGRTPLGTIHESSKGTFVAHDTSGNIITVTALLQSAIDALTARASS
jgi:hypothetical protein